MNSNNKQTIRSEYKQYITIYTKTYLFFDVFTILYRLCRNENIFFSFDKRKKTTTIFNVFPTIATIFIFRSILLLLCMPLPSFFYYSLLPMPAIHSLLQQHFGCLIWLLNITNKISISASKIWKWLFFKSKNKRKHQVTWWNKMK